MTTNLRDWLKARLPTAKGVTLKRMVTSGRVTVNGEVARALNQPLAEGDAVCVDARAAAAAPGADALAPLRLVHEDDDLLVVHKPPGLLTSTVPGETRPTAIALVRAHCSARDPAARPGIIHRLDAAAHGLLVFSKNDAAYQALKAQFFAHSVERVYAAAVHGAPRPRHGRLEGQLVEGADGQVLRARPRQGGERAVTEYEVVAEAAGRALLRVTLHTGRKHQIRVQLAGHGHPLVGDWRYGRRAQTPGGAGLLLLAAVVLAFDHPRSGLRCRFSVPPPAEIARLFPGCPAAAQAW